MRNLLIKLKENPIVPTIILAFILGIVILAFQLNMKKLYVEFWDTSPFWIILVLVICYIIIKLILIVRRWDYFQQIPNYENRAYMDYLNTEKHTIAVLVGFSLTAIAILISKGMEVYAYSLYFLIAAIFFGFFGILCLDDETKKLFSELSRFFRNIMILILSGALLNIIERSTHRELYPFFLILGFSTLFLYLIHQSYRFYKITGGKQNGWKERKKSYNRIKIN